MWLRRGICTSKHRQICARAPIRVCVKVCSKIHSSVFRVARHMCACMCAWACGLFAQRERAPVDESASFRHAYGNIHDTQFLNEPEVQLHWLAVLTPERRHQFEHEGFLSCGRRRLLSKLMVPSWSIALLIILVIDAAKTKSKRKHFFMTKGAPDGYVVWCPPQVFWWVRVGRR